MANTIYSEDIFLDATINAFVKKLAPLKAFSTDFSVDKSMKGTTVSVGLVSAPATGAEFAGDYETGSNTITQKQVTLKHYFKSFEIGMTDANKASVSKLENLAEVNAGALANSIFNEVLSVVVAANFPVANGGYTGAATGFTMAELKSLRGELDALGAGVDGRALVVDSAYETNLIPTDASALNSETVIEGRAGRLMGFDIFGSNYVPANAENIVGIALHKSAIAVATRLPTDAGAEKGAYLTYEVVELPGLGMSVVYKEWFSTKTGSLWGAYEVLIGSAAGTNGGLLIKSAI